MKAPDAEAAEEIPNNFLMKMMSFKKDGIITLKRPETEEEE